MISQILYEIRQKQVKEQMLEHVTDGVLSPHNVDQDDAFIMTTGRNCTTSTDRVNSLIPKSPSSIQQVLLIKMEHIKTLEKQMAM